jgi:hypothetical protein
MATQSRSRTQLEQEESEPPQLIPIRNPDRSLTLAAGSSEAQEKFLQFMGLTKTSIVIQEDNVFEEWEAQVIATALNHVEMLQDFEGDPYFTPEEWRKHQEKISGILDGLYEVAVVTDSLSVDSQLATEYRDCKIPRCTCIAHQSELEAAWKLIDIPNRLTDDWGSKLAHGLLPEIFKRGNVNGMQLDVEDCKQGGMYAVNYILQLPSGESTQFTGWPDFTISRRYMPCAERRITLAYNRRARTLGVGEVESPVTKDKTKAFAQAGLYGVGQLANSSRQKMAVVILYKDKSAQVAVASTHLPSIPLQLSVGDVKYQFVSRADSMSLKDPDDLQEFARILVSTMNWAASP